MSPLRIDQIEARTRRFTPPPDDWTFDDLDNATQEVLLSHGLPPRPDKTLYPDLYDAWRELVQPPLRLVDVEFQFYSQDDQYLRTGGPRIRSRHQSSRNWSGASVSPRDGRMITEVTGKWKVPFIAAPTDGHFRCSTWIGLDGQRSYLDASLPQIGTARQVTQLGSSVTFKAYSWIQWYPRIDETIIPTLDFLPGQRAGAYMMVLPPAPLPFPPDTPGLPDPHWVFFYLTNLSVLTLSGYHPYAAFAWPVPECGWPDPEAPPFMQPEVAGGTAQWVMERPTVAGSDELRQFPIYNEVQFTDCYAKTAFKPGETGRPEEFTGPNLIRMHSDGRIRNQSVVVSRAERPLELGGLPNERYFRTSPPPV